MFSSLLPLWSYESVTGGFMVKPLVQSDCKVLRSMQLGAVIKCWAANQNDARGTLWRWRFAPKPQTALTSHVLVEVRICSYHIFREWLTAATFGSMQLGAVIKCLAAYQKNIEKCTGQILMMTIHPEATDWASSKIWMEQLTCPLPCCHGEAMNQWMVASWVVKPLVQSHCKVSTTPL